MQIIDAHLDLAYNALRGRAILLPAREQTPDEDGTPSVGLPDLRAGNVNLICATLYCDPWSDKLQLGYRNAEEARAAAMSQLHWYQTQLAAGQMRLIRTPSDLQSQSSITPAMILLMEGADPLRTPEDVAEWFTAGLRIVGLAWRRTRHAGGTGEPGPLTPEGRATVRALDAVGIIHDTSHLAEESFWQLLDQTAGPIFASHSNCRALIPTDRQLSDEMIKALAARNGVVGINFFDKFLLSAEKYGKERATLHDVIAQIRHLADLLGNCAHIGIGTDMDGGFGSEHLPQELQTAADMPRLADALAAANFSDTDIAGILSANFLRFFKKSLPAWI